MPCLISRVNRWAETRPDAPAYRYVDYSTDPAGAMHTLSWFQADTRARAIAARISQLAAPGERAVILAPPGLDYVTAFLGACYAKVIAVPLFAPGLPAHRERLRLAFNDSAPTTVLTTTATAGQVENFLNTEELRPPDDMVCVDDVPSALGERWSPRTFADDDIAYLQYTSGSTDDPTGVEITHGNFTANAEQLQHAFDPKPGEIATVSWLPLHHDMGLMLAVLLPMRQGDYSVFTDPISFLVRPARWLQLLAQPHDVYTAGPNFAYDYCVKRVSDEEKAGIDLSSVRVFGNGAEPIRSTTMSRFTAAFLHCGLKPEMLTSVYGLAEATVFVATTEPDRAPDVTTFDAEALAEGSARPAGAGRQLQLVSCGRAVGQRVRIVDPVTGHPRQSGEIGEIQVNGPNVTRRYWRKPLRSAELLDAGWLRTGDLGMYHDGQLYVTGRLKDLIIVDGRNHYPQDIEATAHGSHPDLRPGRVTAFSVPGSDTERLVVVAEYEGSDPSTVERAVRVAVHQRHDLPAEVLVTTPGSVARTTSGKLARRATRRRYLAGELQACGS